ncbi:MAG: alanyl-tRNA editing protein [Oscillospiraceae bacterium]|nr:alanyl-tRNA editing protein [Oscillospiraceae bacterium]
MTEKLYYKDSHIRDFTAGVISCSGADGRFHVELDRTAFFPEGGGQPGDTGVIGEVRVLDTQETGGRIVHVTDAPVTVGADVACSLDWDLRFRRMQHHSGEHIVSGLVHSLYGYDNVGFHLGEDDVTMDFDGELTRDDLDRIELLANEAVYKDIPIVTLFPSPASLPRLSYRSKLELTENVRLVRIPGYDLCACCAPHVKRTGEIGLIKLTDFMRHRGGVRIHLLAGADALADYRAKYANVVAISNSLSAPQNDTAQAVDRMKRELSDLKLDSVKLRRELVGLKAAALRKTSGNICLFEPELDTDMMRQLCNAGTAVCSGMCAVFTGSDSGGYKYIIGSRTTDLRERVRDINAVLSGRGGGSPEMIQGSVTASRSEIENYFN